MRNCTKLDICRVIASFFLSNMSLFFLNILHTQKQNGKLKCHCSLWFTRLLTFSLWSGKGNPFCIIQLCVFFNDFLYCRSCNKSMSNAIYLSCRQNSNFIFFLSLCLFTTKEARKTWSMSFMCVFAKEIQNKYALSKKAYQFLIDFGVYTEMQ